MKIFSDKQIIKKISLMLVVITLFNVFLPLTSLAEDDEITDEQIGGTLFRPIAQLFAGIGDLGIQLLQKFFVGNGSIKNGDTFDIKISPGIIFSNELPGLDANFINPSDKTVTRVTEEEKNTYLIESLKIEGAELVTQYQYTDALRNSKWFY